MTPRTQVPAWEQATHLLLCLTPIVFDRVMEGRTEPDMDEIAFTHWFNLRKIITLYEQARSCRLSPEKAEKLTAGLDYIHGQVEAHVMSHSECPCRTASIIRQLRQLIHQEQEAAAHA